MAQLLLLMVGGAAAGVFGALLGLGGGVLIVPLLTLGFGLPLREPIGTSLVCVIVTSSSAASVYLRRNVANLRLGMTLELFTALGAMAGGLIAFALPDRVLAVMFGALLMFVAATMALGVRRAPEPQQQPESERSSSRSSSRSRSRSWRPLLGLTLPRTPLEFHGTSMRPRFRAPDIESETWGRA